MDGPCYTLKIPEGFSVVFRIAVEHPGKGREGAPKVLKATCPECVGDLFFESRGVDVLACAVQVAETQHPVHVAEERYSDFEDLLARPLW